MISTANTILYFEQLRLVKDMFDDPEKFQVRLVKLKSDEILVWRVSSAVLETA